MQKILKPKRRTRFKTRVNLMKLVTFTHEDHTRIGALTEAGIIDFSALAPELPKQMIAFLEAGDSAMAKAQQIIGNKPATLDLKEVVLEAPVMSPRKVMAIGLNYADHIAETGRETPQHQIWFSKSPTSIVGPHASILKPAVSDFIDYEAELCLIIGKRARHVPRDQAHKVIAGYCCGNDVSVRDWQMRTGQFTIGKSFDTHGPIGPALTTADEVGDPHNLALQCFVNGERRQNSNTKHLIFDCFAQIEELTKAMTLEPGDVIFTGTPDGVGAAMNPIQFLKAGDKVRVDIEKLGAIENTLIEEAPTMMIN